MMLYDRHGTLADVPLAGATITAERLDESDGRPWTVHITGPGGVDVVTGHFANRRHAEHNARLLALHRGPGGRR